MFILKSDNLVSQLLTTIMSPQNQPLYSSCLHTINGHLLPVTCVAISPDGQTLISGSNDDTIELRNIVTSKLLRMIDAQSQGYGSSSGVSCLAITPDGNTIISGTRDEKIKLWNFQTGKLLHTFDDSDLFTPVVLAITPDGKTLACGSGSFSCAGEVGTISLWNLVTRKLICLLDYNHRGKVNSFAIAISPDGRKIITESGMGENLLLLDIANGNILDKFRISSDYMHSSTIVISPDGQILVRGRKQSILYKVSGQIEAWHLATGKLLYNLTQQSVYVESLAISPDGNTLFGGCSDKTIKIWDLPTGELLTTLTGHQDAVGSIAISRSGKILVSGSRDCTVKIWQVN